MPCKILLYGPYNAWDVFGKYCSEEEPVYLFLKRQGSFKISLKKASLRVSQLEVIAIFEDEVLQWD